jgi:hypothetical protein
MVDPESVPVTEIIAPAFTPFDEPIVNFVIVV